MHFLINQSILQNIILELYSEIIIHNNLNNFSMIIKQEYLKKILCYLKI